MEGKNTSSPSSQAQSSTATTCIKIAAFVALLSFSLFFLSKHFSADTAAPNEHLYFLNATRTSSTVTAAAPAQSPPRSSGPVLEKTGIINELGVMTADFIIGDFDEALLKSLEGKERSDNGERVKRENDEGEAIKVEKFRACDVGMADFAPQLENVGAASKGLDCLVPKPKGYKLPLPWPKSRDEVWLDNVRYTPEDDESRKRVSRKDDKLVFKGGGSESDQDLDKMVPEIALGQRTRVALDFIGSGISNFGAYLIDKNVTTLSLALKDNAKQVQIALERGVPAVVNTFGTRRLPFPSQGFDLIRCSSCGMKWTLDDGILLIEANRILRGGGYFVWEAEAVYKYDGKLGEQWREMEDLTRNLCWELVNKEGYIAIWQKPLNNSCYLDRDQSVKLSLCDTDDDPDDIWNVEMKKCIARLPENGDGANVTSWPSRLHTPPNRLFSIKTDSDVSRWPLYRADAKFWNAVIDGYTRVFKINEMKIRNVLDMKAGYGGFAAALLESKANSWVMNVVPTSSPNTLPVIYDRGLIGVMHDWCEPFETYPRTYDLINVAGLFSVERRRCNVTNIMLEIDRILRPDGRVYIRDTTVVIYELREIATSMGWMVYLFDTEEGPYSNWKLLRCTKPV